MIPNTGNTGFPMSKNNDLDKAALNTLADTFSIRGFFSDVLGWAFGWIGIMVLALIGGAVGLAFYLDIPFLMALSLVPVLVLIGWIISIFSDSF